MSLMVAKLSVSRGIYVMGPPIIIFCEGIIQRMMSMSEWDVMRLLYVTVPCTRTSL